jgi:hypothetical protein
MLTEKAKKDFEKWYFKKHCKSRTKFEKLFPHQKSEIFDWFYETISFTFQYGVYLDWLDSIKLQVIIPKWVDKFYFKIENNFESDICYNDRLEATYEAIKKANEIYNKSQL